MRRDFSLLIAEARETYQKAALRLRDATDEDWDELKEAADAAEAELWALEMEALRSTRVD